MSIKIDTLLNKFFKEKFARRAFNRVKKIIFALLINFYLK